MYNIYNQKVCPESFASSCKTKLIAVALVGSGDEGGAISLQRRNLRSHSPSCRILPSSVG